MMPLFVCYANCCRSVLASYFYRHLCDEAPVLSAGFEPGERVSERAVMMLAYWGDRKGVGSLCFTLFPAP